MRKPHVVGTAFEYLNPTPSDFGPDEMVAQEYQCHISPYYENLADYAVVFATMSTKTYYPLRYMNNTDTIDEVLCVALSDYIEEKSCNHNTVVPDQAYYDSLTSTE